MDTKENSGIQQAKKFITEKSVSALTGLSLSTLRKDRFYGKRLPFYKIGKSVRYALDDVYAFMEQHKIKII